METNIQNILGIIIIDIRLQRVGGSNKVYQ